MLPNFDQLSELISHRRSVFPAQYRPESIPDEVIMRVLENARWAPNHKKTEPWRFIVFREGSRSWLADFLMHYYKENTPAEQFDPIKMKKAGEKPMQSAAIIAICIERSPTHVIPAWEETAAVACAVHNIWLSCACLGIGGYWSTPAAIKNLAVQQQLPQTQECLGLFYMGWSDEATGPGIRRPLQELVKFA